MKLVVPVHEVWCLTDVGWYKINTNGVSLGNQGLR